MSELRVRQAGILLLLLCGGTLLGSSCVDVKIGGRCDVTEDCITEVNFSGNGAMCILGVCRCPDPSDEVCCPDGGWMCANEVYSCRPKVECAAALLASAGFTCEPAPPPECGTDSECDGPPDPRCGTARCVEGRCELDVLVGEPINNQTPGDCKQIVCSIEGDLWIWHDPSDLPLDGNPCTFDLCDGDEPINPALPDKSPCPGEDYGICVLGQCRDCSEALDWKLCPVEGNICNEYQCVPVECTDDVQNELETSIDCGGTDCQPCGAGYACKIDSDCVSNVCNPDTLLCEKSTHSDGEQNDSETGVDCGHPGGASYQCKDGEGCDSSADCMSQICYDGFCQAPTCLDAVQNGSEAGEDCGAPEPGCPACPE